MSPGRCRRRSSPPSRGCSRRAGETRLLLIGNPTQSGGPFFDAFHAQAGAYRTFRTSAFDTPNLRRDAPDAERRSYLVAREWVEERRALWGESSDLYRSRVLAQFPRAGGDRLFPLALLDAALADGPPGLVGSVTVGVDVARFGSDATAYSRIERGLLVDQEEVHGASTMVTAGRIVRLFQDQPSLALAIDDTGVGGGVTDRLRELGLAPLAVNFGAAARDREHYANRAGELYHRLRAALEHGRLHFRPDLPTRDALLGQLAQVVAVQHSDGRLAVRKRGLQDRGASPDLADSLALAWAAHEEELEGPGLW